LIHNEAHSEWIPEQWAKLTKELIERYKPIDVRMDAGALGKPIMIEMQKRWNIPVNPAEKVEKMSNIELLNGDFRSGRFYVSDECKDLIHQMSILTKNSKGTGEDQALPNDRCDSMLYAWRHCYHFLHQESEAAPNYGSDEWFKREEERMLQYAVEQDSPTNDDDWMQELEYA